MSGQAAEPPLVLRRGLRERVLVADPREVIVARIRVAAAAVRLALRERFVVVALDGEHARRAKKGKDAVGVGPEAAHVPETEHGLDVAPAHIREHGLEGEGVAVDAAEDGDAPVLGYPFLHVIPVCTHVTQAGW